MIATHLEKNHGHVENATGLVGRQGSALLAVRDGSKACLPDTHRNTTLDELRNAIDGDRRRLCVALGLRADNGRFFCPKCQSDGLPHADGGTLSRAHLAGAARGCEPWQHMN